MRDFDLDTEYGLCPELFIEVYFTIKDTFCDKVNVDADIWPTEHAFWKRHWKQLRESIKEIDLLPKDHNYLNKLYKTAQGGGAVTFDMVILNILAKYCDHKNLSYLIQSDDITDDAKISQTEYNLIRDIVELSPDSSTEETLYHYVDTQWWLYLYGYNSTAKHPIVRLKFFIGNRVSDFIYVRVENTEEKDHPDYIGYIDIRYSTKHFIVCNLRTLTNNRFLHIKFNIETERAAEICLGHYSNYDDNNLISGTLIMQQADERFREQEPSTYNETNIKDADIPQVIQDYFREKAINYTKTPRNIFSLDRLANWKDSYDQRT